jgi:dTDP-glucose pyrophosphorylase
MWGIIPAAGLGSRIQPIACSKELLPLGSRWDGQIERPRAVSEYVIDRMVSAGVSQVCIVISPDKSDIVQYYGAGAGAPHFAYVVQPSPLGLCDAIFRALPLIPPDEHVLVGLPDTLWFPEHGLRCLDDSDLSFLLFRVAHPELFDAVITDEQGRVVEIQVKRQAPGSSWIWGAFKVKGSVLRALFDLWCERDRIDPLLGTLVNAYLARGGVALAVRAGEAYVDVGTLSGYREAIALLTGGAR